MKLLLGSYKGGPGKSTLATNIAVILAKQGRDVLLLDCDPQASSLTWAAVRAKAGINSSITCLSAAGESVNKEVDRLVSKFDDVIIDTAGHDSEELRSAMLTADVLVTPVEVSKFDTDTLSEVCRIIRTSRIYNPTLKCYLVPNKVHSNKSRAAAQMLRMEELAAKLPEFILTEHGITTRVMFADIVEDGLAVSESSDRQAADDMRKVCKAVCHAYL